ncbi:MAG: CDP-diacylglycerol--serine O-phosphatidyltransferase [Desulfotomaculaceae bacterium]|nr:CDP-diacylglycerol--serine O-phosphatidyltransferase [Desulfotomaculaceae bacterium]
MSRVEMLPNLCTAFNLMFGVAAIAAVINGNFQLSAALIIVSAVLDRADGILARRYNVASAFGREFDSLADLVSFGVAPSALLYSNMIDWWSPAGLVCFAIFTLCGAFRLARFNISSDTTSFQGVPITVAGAVLAIAVILIPNPAVMMAVALLISIAMVSSVRIPKV